LREVDEVLGGIRPGIYGIIGDSPLPLHLALQCLQRNDDVCLYYGYVNPPMMALHRLTAYGLKVPVAQLLVDTRTTLTRNSGFGAFRLRMRFMNFVDMYEQIPILPLSVDRMIKDIQSVREQDDQLVVICIDDFERWLRTSLQGLAAEEADPRRLVDSLFDFSQIYKAIILVPCKGGSDYADLLTDISNATIEVEAHGLTADQAHGQQRCTLTVRSTISEAPLEYTYSNDLECFLEKVGV
jgi:hypothetical protein